MTVARTRAVGAVLTAAACVAVLSMTPAFQSGVRTLLAEVGLIANDGFIMGGTGNPIPDPNYLTSVENLYLNQLPPTYNYVPRETPEQFCPIECSSPGQLPLTFGQSVNAGVGDLHTAVDQLLTDGTNNVSVLGYSQSATVATSG